MQKENKAYELKFMPARRVDSVEEYYFSKKLKEVAEMNAAGRKVINLGVGSPDMPPSAAAIEAFCEEVRRDDVHGYQPYVGMPALREAFAEWYGRWYGVSLDPKTEIQPLIGSKEGIIHISLTFVNAGEGVLVPNPGYPTYTSASRLVAADVIEYRLDEARGWYPDFEAIERTIVARRYTGQLPVKLMWMNYPNMPTGANATLELYKRAVDFGRRHRIIICNDNPYSFILNDTPLSILQIDGAKEVCIELNSMSKSHNMPGWRMAMLASNERFVSWILKVKSNVDSGQFRPMQTAAIEALKAGKEWYEANNAIYRSRRLIAEGIMDALGCTYDRSQTGMFLWGKVADSAASGAAVADHALYEHNVFITPGSVFGDAGKRYVRISLCCKNETLEEAKQRITNGE
ncbi:MAG: aminotransferase class I/II-fold pyridoxal phosphate-dependent enzyme [Tannerella sp.]|jgi:aspartate/methionine/tyrosine aminotransferase|nr:aminotransferase class I/II-fold pyridoxal phosphate-dependent enzyme [Tannerella sp.]